MADTNKQFDQVTAKCRRIFIDKMADYGASWRIFRLHGISDQLYIKVKNIRQRQETGVSLVGDDIEGNLRAIVNYGVMAIIQERKGYADGVDRHLSCGKGWFTINGHKVPVIGNICMDMTMLDVTGVDVNVGDTVTIFGDDPTVTELAEVLDTIPYEIMTSVPRRIERIIVK